MSGVKVKLDTKNLIADLKGYQLRSLNKLEKAIELTAEETILDAKKTLRDEGHVDTGRLMASIHWESKRTPTYSYNDKKKNTFSGDFAQGVTEEFEVAIGSNVFYAVEIESRFPFLNPAKERAQKRFLKDLKNVAFKL